MSATSRDKPRYAIIDEPRSGPLERLAMNPLLPFIAYMVLAPLGGVLFITNALAMRARTMGLEIGFAATGIVLWWLRSFEVAALVDWVMARGWLSEPQFVAWAFSIKYLLLIPLAIGMWCGYKVFLWQSATHEVLTYFDRASERKGRTR